MWLPHHQCALHLIIIGGLGALPLSVGAGADAPPLGAPTRAKSPGCQAISRYIASARYHTCGRILKQSS